MINLFCPGGAHFAPLSTNTRRSMLKNLTFRSKLYPIKFSRFAEKKDHQKHQNFKRGDPYKLSQMPLNAQNISKVKHYFGGF